MGIKTYQEKNAKPMKKELAQSDLPVWRKIQKTTRNATFLKKCVFGWFLGFFSKLVSPIELILSPWSQCLSRACFDRSLDRSATTLNFDPIMGIFKISKVKYEGQISSKRFISFAKHLILCHNKRICSKMEDFLCIPPPKLQQ